MIYLIAGPPCSGKSTLARKLAKPGDRVLDFDDICAELTGRRGWAYPWSVREQAARIMDERIAALRGYQGDAYVIRCAPDPAVRRRLAAALNAQVCVLNPGPRECLRRARGDRRPPRTGDAIRDWYLTYRASPLDQQPPEATGDGAQVAHLDPQGDAAE